MLEWKEKVSTQLLQEQKRALLEKFYNLWKNLEYSEWREQTFLKEIQHKFEEDIKKFFYTINKSKKKEDKIKKEDFTLVLVKDEKWKQIYEIDTWMPMIKFTYDINNQETSRKEKLYYEIIYELTLNLENKKILLISKNNNERYEILTKKVPQLQDGKKTQSISVSIFT